MTATWDTFHDVVNMTSAELRDWLASDAVRELDEEPAGAPVGSPAVDEWDDSELIDVGWRVVTILSKREGDLTDDDRDLMTRVTAYVNSHVTRRPEDENAARRWRYALMSVGHDPLNGT